MFHKLRIKIAEAFMQKVWEGHATQCCGASEFYSSGIRIFCKYSMKEFIDTSLSKIKEFDSDLWENLRHAINEIIFVKKGESQIVPGKRIVVINENDQSHISTPTHLASWLVYYAEKLNRANDGGLTNWYSQRRDSEIEIHAKQQRTLFLSGPKNANYSTNEIEPNQLIDPTWTTPVLKAKSDSQAGHE